jgi:O-antigen/teichoic acid export membrane protein
MVYLGLGLARLVIGGAFVVAHPTQTAGMVGITLAAVVPAVVGGFALRRRPGEDASPVVERRHPTRDILGETAHNSQALLAFFALSNSDVIVSRHALDTHEAGVYAAGLILAKALMFLPQFVIVVAFPELSTESRRRAALLRSLGLVGAIGAVGVGGAALLPGLATVFVGGGAYAEVSGHLWIFALLGTVLAMLQLLVYAVLARLGRRPVLLVWAAVVVLVGLGLTTSSVSGLLVVVLTVDAVLLAALVATDVRRA